MQTSTLVNSRRALLGLICFWLTACQDGSNVSVAFDKDLSHKTGLALSRPAGFAETALDNGFSFSETGDVRSPRTIKVSVADAQPVLAQAQERELADATTAIFAVRELGGGSGGTEYELTAAKPSDESWIVAVAIEQSELGAPSFETAWKLLEKSQLPARP